MAELYECYNVGDNTLAYAYGNSWLSQTFTPSKAHKITSVRLLLGRVGSPGIITISIRATDGEGCPTGADLCSGAINGSTLPTSSPWEWREIALNGGYDLDADTKYAIVVRAVGGDISNRLVWRLDSTDPTYPRGNYEYSSSGGSSWIPNTTRELMFEERGGDPTYYFNARHATEVWTSDPDYMVDNILTNYASTTLDADIQRLITNTCPGDDLGTITKVEIRAYGYGDVDDQLIIRPEFTGGAGDNHVTVPGTTPGWGAYQDITSDSNAPDWSLWSHIQDLDCDIEFNAVSKGNTVYCAKVEIRVTHDWKPPESDIDVGADPIDRLGSGTAELTWVDKNNPANASGTLHSIKVYVAINIIGLRVGTFYTTNGNTLKCRDSEVIGDVEAGAERTFTELSIAVQEGDYIGCYFASGNIDLTVPGYNCWYVSGEYIDPNDEAEYTPYAGAFSLYGYGDIGGQDYPIETSTGLTAGVTIGRALAYDRGMSPGLTMAVTVVGIFGRLITTNTALVISTTIAKQVAFKRAVIADLTTAVSVVKGWGRAIATTANLAVSVTVAMSKGFVRSVVSALTASATVDRGVTYTRDSAPGLTASVTVDRNVTYTRATQSALSVAVSIIKSWGRTITTSPGLTVAISLVKSWGRTITTAPGLAIGTIISKQVAFVRSLTPGLTASATVDREVAYNRATLPGLSVAVTIVKGWGRKIATSANLTVSTVITRQVAYGRAIIADLTTVVSVVKGWGRSIATTTALAVSTTINRIFGKLVTTSSGLTISVTIAKSWGRTIATSANLTVSATISRVTAYKRATQTVLSMAVTIVKSWGKTFTTSTALAISTTVDRTVAYKRAAQPALSVAVSVVRVFGKTITSTTGLTISTTVVKGWGRTITTSAGLTVSATISRVVAYKRAVSSGLTVAVSIVRSWTKTIATSTRLIIAVSVVISKPGRQRVIKVITSQYRSVAVITSQFRLIKTLTAQYRQLKIVTTQKNLVKAITTAYRKVKSITTGG